MRGVVLTPLRDEDSDTMFEWINDRELVVLNAPFEPVPRAAHDRWFKQIREREDVEILGIRLAEDERLIGSCQLNGIDRESGAAQLQIRIGDRSQWSRGYGTEAVRELLRYGFGSVRLKRIGLQVFADNQRAINAYEKAGFRRVRSVGDLEIEGESRELIEMEATAEADA